MGRAAIFGERKVQVRALTDRQAEVLDYMWHFYQENDQPPTHEAICAFFNFSSPNAAQDHIKALARRGWLEKNAIGKWKFTQATRTLMAEVLIAEVADAAR